MLKIENLTKKFRDSTVFEDLNYVFEEGKIYGIKGYNGTGKTVLLKIIAGLSKPTTGNIYYQEKTCDDNYRPSMGVIIENPIFWGDKTGKATLKFLADIKKEINDEKIDEYLEKVGLYEVKDKLVKKYSLGMRQRLAIAQALMENPNLILLDEPTNSLDEQGIDIFKKVIVEERSKGKIILIVSHKTEDIIDICDQILYLKDRKLLKDSK